MGIDDRPQPAVVDAKAARRLETQVELPLLIQQAVHVVLAQRAVVLQEGEEAPQRRRDMQLRHLPVRQPPVEERTVQPQCTHCVAARPFMRVKRA